LFGNGGGTIPRVVVATLTLAVPLPVPKVLGLVEQVVYVAVTGREQDRFTCAEKPFCAVMVMALVNVAV